LKLTETNDYSLIEPFFRGEGVRRRCGAGKNWVDDAKKAIANPKNYFLLAEDDAGKAVGFVCFYPHGPAAYSLHVCLRTVGKKTKKLIGIALSYARLCLYARHIYAIYPQANRAVVALCRHFGFRPDKSFSGADAGMAEPHNFERLDLI
jgi:hypothetical protein